MPADVLIVTTSANVLGKDHPTGLWLEEFAVPYLAFVERGLNVTVASPDGGQVPLDPKTTPSEKERLKWAPALEALRSTARLADVADRRFDAVFVPGGHGPLTDLVRNAVLQRLLGEHDAAGAVVSAVCHGPAALLHVERADGRPLLEGRRATGFTNVEERLAGLHDVVPFLLEDEMKKAGATFKSALIPLLSHVEVDGNLITGQNPNSSEKVAQAVIEALQGKGG